MSGLNGTAGGVQTYRTDLENEIDGVPTRIPLATAASRDPRRKELAVSAAWVKEGEKTSPSSGVCRKS